MNDKQNQESIDSVLNENRKFAAVSPESVGAKKWNISSLKEYQEMFRESIESPETFYSKIAEDLHWFKKWEKVLEYKAPDARWFVGAKTNLCYNCADRQVDAGYGEQTAIIWEGEPILSGKPEIKKITYQDLKRETAKCANALKGLGVKKGDVVSIYMGMVPELAIAVLACARIGAAHSVIFGGFSANAIADRVLDAKSEVIITCDGLYRRGAVVPLKDKVDEAIKLLEKQGEANLVKKVLCLKRCNNEIVVSDRDVFWSEYVGRQSDECPCEELDSEDMSFLLYTSGSTGKPKGIKHTVAGYMIHTYLTSKYVFNLIPDCNQVFWCTADIGWITGHSYILYGVLPNRVPTLMYEGAPNFPDEGRFWDIIERHKVTQFYTAPTAIRAFMKWGDEHPEKRDLSSLQVLGTVGEPINPAAWIWYREKIGRGICPIVDTYWQTETGGHVITPLPGLTSTKPGSCTLPFFGIDAAVCNKDGQEVGANQGGLLVIRKPWPSMLRGVYGDRERFIDTYWSTVRVDGEPVYTAGDGARRDDDGYFWVMGRIDDVINVSGHRLGTMEIESALVSSDLVVEAAVVGIPHEIKGTGIAAFVTLEKSVTPKSKKETEELRNALRAHVAKEIGALAKPDMIRFTDALPKTRSGKIMRRLLRSIASGEKELSQDTSTLEDFSILAKLSDDE